MGDATILTDARLQPARLEPDAKLIAALETLLDQARRGELGGLAYVGYLVDRELTYGFVGPEMAQQLLRTYGLLHWLASRAMRRWDSATAGSSTEG